MAGLTRLLSSIVGVLGLPPWAGPLIFLALVALSWPLIKGNMATDSARKLLKGAARERGIEREKMEEQALEAVKGRPHGLVVVAEMALSQGRRDLAVRAVGELRGTGKLLPELRKLERQLEPPLPGMPYEAVVIIDRLLKAGATAEAQERLAAAQRKWPGDEEIEELAKRMA
jgi:hypothetical protein